MFRHIVKTKLLQKIHQQIPKKQEKIHKKYNFRKKYSYLPEMWSKKKKKYHRKDFILFKKMQKKFFSGAFTSDK